LNHHAKGMAGCEWCVIQSHAHFFNTKVICDISDRYAFLFFPFYILITMYYTSKLNRRGVYSTYDITKDLMTDDLRYFILCLPAQ